MAGPTQMGTEKLFARATLEYSLRILDWKYPGISFTSFLRGTNSGVKQLTFKSQIDHKYRLITLVMQSLNLGEYRPWMT